MKRGNDLKIMNDEIIAKVRESKIKNTTTRSRLTRHGAPLIEDRYYMPRPRMPRTNLNNDAALVRQRRIASLREEINMGINKLRSMGDHLGRLENAISVPMEELKNMVENRRRSFIRKKLTANTNKPVQQQEVGLGLNPNAAAPPPNYIPFKDRKKTSTTNKPQANIRPTGKPSPEMKQQVSENWAEIEQKILGDAHQSDEYDTADVSRMSTMIPEVTVNIPIEEEVTENA